MIKLTSKILLSFLFVFVAGIFQNKAYASEYELHWLPPQNHVGNCFVDGSMNGFAGSLKRLAGSFDDATGLFIWEATFSPCNNTVLPSGFNLAVNDGQNPQKENAKGLAFIYFDASKLLDGKNSPEKSNYPIVSIYKYNKMLPSYHQHQSAPIVSNHPDFKSSLPLHKPSDWLIEASVKDSEEPHADNTGKETVRTFRLVLKANHVINGKAEAGNVLNDFRASPSWYGIGFGISSGIWFHPWIPANTAQNPDSVYYCTPASLGQDHCSQGRLGFARHTNYFMGWYDTDHFPANKVPYCTVEAFGSEQLLSSNPKCYEVPVGEKFAARVTGYDSEKDTLRADVTGAPKGSVLSPNANSGQFYPNPLAVDFSWTPQKSDISNPVNVKVKFTDQGQKTGYASIPQPPNAGWCYPPEQNFPTSTSCIIPLCVVPVHAPCEITVDNAACEGTTTTVDFTFFPDSNQTSQLDLLPECKDKSGKVIASEILGALPGTTTGQVKVATGNTTESVSCKLSLSYVSETCDGACSKEFTISACPRDCANIPNGNTKIDQCGVCGGDGKSCLDCAGVVNGTTVVDACGVCGGKNACLDCAGTPFGKKVVDACGVCGGDGSSCTNDCKATDIAALLFQMDGNAAAQKGVVLKSLNIFLRNRNGSAAQAYANDVSSRANVLYLDSWTLTWGLPKATLECTNPGANCVEANFTSNVNSYDENAKELYALARITIVQIRKAAGTRKDGRPAGARLLTEARKALRESLSTSQQVPTKTLVCSEKRSS